LFREKHAIKKIQKRFRSRKRERDMDLFMQNNRKPLLEYGNVARDAMASRSAMNASNSVIPLFFANVLNKNKQWGRQIASHLDSVPLNEAKIKLMEIAQSEEFKYVNGIVEFNNEETTRSIPPWNFGELINVDKEDHNDMEGVMRYEFIFEHVKIFVNVDYDTELQLRLNEVYEILEKLVPETLFMRR